MATNTAGSAGQKYHTNQTHFLAETVTFTTLGTSNTVTIGVLPPRALVLRGNTWIKTAFNDTNGDDLDVELKVGDLVEVPFGWDNTPLLARVEVAGEPPVYNGWGMKWVNARYIIAPDSNHNPF